MISTTFEFPAKTKFKFLWIWYILTTCPKHSSTFLSTCPKLNCLICCPYPLRTYFPKCRTVDKAQIIIRCDQFYVPKYVHQDSVMMGWTHFYRTSNELKQHFWMNELNVLEHVFLLMIKLEHLNFGFERTNIEHWTYKAFY